mmetsp:Transcript_40330/g.121507  ORF Transcript_40330/g.121507 Transcript_40330/m.121507 type:complete len:384 (-) Transcript_40330:147-1298(-)|eukprot:CAMPEP_0113590026 /NCGR_PEP_ID=MMETSP0015_2-20120614/36431_1 /TAXON_ID=2838 /ORGANISM="Odontella" /LENGTH=383 /DNA_ID=CAMNT_0000496143 /DNA_START=86 /DNA_END=1237 /DNA_ORIENTATION=+ /assembly_acc=CAM_ASM_000160
MKLSAAIFAISFGSALALQPFKEETIDLGAQNIKADSKLGNKLLSSARRLDDGDASWVVGYSLKFQGCHHISQWNDDADGEDAPKIQTKRLVRFRLCPTGTCAYEDASGCDSGYGDYIIDMNIFLESYIQNKMEQQEYQCEYAEAYTCAGCANADNADYCRYDCFSENGLDFCNEDDNDDGQEQFELDRYMYCAEWDLPNNGRKLEDGDGDVGYFIGPYCSDQGGKIHLGVFTDEYCTNFAEDEENGVSNTDFYYQYAGQALPYSSESLIGMDCISCADNENGNNNNNGNVAEMCEEIYEQAGKCEENLSPNSYNFYANENACSYIEGIKIVRSDGIVMQNGTTHSSTATIVIGAFAGILLLLGAYVYYLKTKLDRAKVNLSE